MSLAKYRVVRDMKFNGRQFKRGDAIARDYIMDTNPEKLGTLLRTRFIEEPPHVKLEDLSKEELLDIAADVGADVDGRYGVARIIEAIQASKHDTEAGTANEDITPMEARRR